MRQRQQQIVKYVNRNMLAGIDELATFFGVSEITIRRDIDYLASISLLKKIKGGAQMLKKVDIVKEVALLTRINNNINKKRDICREAFSLIQQGQSVFVGGSTTILPLSKLIAENNPQITIVTNGVFASIELAKADKVKVISVGGILDSETMCFEGVDIPGWVDSFTFDIAFFSSAAFEPMDGTFESSIALMGLKRNIANRSKKVVYLADSTKFGNRALIKILDVSALELVITDEGVNPKYIKVLEEKGVKVLVAPCKDKQAN